MHTESYLKRLTVNYITLYIIPIYGLQAEDALSSNDTEVVLEVVGELVQATAADDAPQLPQDLDTTNEIISDTLDLLFNDLDTAVTQNDTNVTVTVVRMYFSIFFHF